MFLQYSSLVFHIFVIQCVRRELLHRIMAPDKRMYDAGNRKEELLELKVELNANNVKDRKNALKRVVAGMSLGRDMSSLFPDVVKNTTGDLSMKKLIYLYIINYAHANANLSILIVNTFIKDANDPNPLIRALAIRTMALIPLPEITEHLCNPLHAALKDTDPYVRKTAAVCVAKLYDTNPSFTVEEGFISGLQKLVSDSNAMTVANAVAVLSEISEASQDPSLLPLNRQTVPRFLSALSECTEWGQVFILDAIAGYMPQDSSEVDLMVERIIARFQHANPAVVLAAVRVTVGLIPRLDSEEKRAFLLKKMSAPLVTLLKSEPEMQYVVLRNLLLLVRSFPSLLAIDVRALFVSYTDPLYVKKEKLDIFVQIADESNCELLLDELLEYAVEVDVAFSQQAISSISQIALRLPSRAEKCVSMLMSLLGRKLSHITEQIAIVTMDICRRYPKQHMSLVSALCDSVVDMSDSYAKCALVWILGEHAKELTNALEILEIITTNIADENAAVQLQILTACVKCFLLRGTDAQSITNFALQYALEQSENADLRDRGFMYSRLVALGQNAMQKILLCQKPTLSDFGWKISADLHKELISSLSTVAAVYHKPTRMFQGSKEKVSSSMPVGESMAEDDLLGLEEEDNSNVEAGPPGHVSLNDPETGASSETSFIDSLLDLPTTGKNITSNTPIADLSTGDFELGSSAVNRITRSSNKIFVMKTLLSKENGKGLEVSGELVHTPFSGTAIRMMLKNFGQSTMSDFAIQLNKNLFGFRPATGMPSFQPLETGKSAEIEIQLDCTGDVDESKGYMLQIALKYTPGGVVYFVLDASCSFNALLDKERGHISKQSFLSAWSAVPDSAEYKTEIIINETVSNSLDHLSKILEDNGIFTIVKKMNAKPRVMYLSSKLLGPTSHLILTELTLPQKGSFFAVIASRTSLGGEVGKAALQKFGEVCARLLE